MIGAALQLTLIAAVWVLTKRGERKRPQNCVCGRFGRLMIDVSYGKNGKRIGRRIMLTMVDTRINGKPALA